MDCTHCERYENGECKIGNLPKGEVVILKSEDECDYFKRKVLTIHKVEHAAFQIDDSCPECEIGPLIPKEKYVEDFPYILHPHLSPEERGRIVKGIECLNCGKWWSTNPRTNAILK